MMCLGIPAMIVEITDAERQLALVDVSGVQREINIMCVVDEDHPLEACIGDWVLVHVGFAMSRINEAEAAETLKVLSELGELQEELAAIQRSESSGPFSRPVNSRSGRAEGRHHPGGTSPSQAISEESEL
jgi:hydrogenase expression/formation protein HypC